MRILKDTVRPELARIKRELEALKGAKVHIGVLGEADSSFLMIAGVHEYGATIHPKKVKNLTIPLTKEAKAAKSPRAFNDLEWIPGHDPGVSFLARRKKRRKKGPSSDGITPADDYNPDDYTWMYMLVKKVNIPERSFIRASYDTGQDTLERICKEAVDGIVREGWTAQEAADHIGKWALEMTREYFNTKLSPEKSDTTMRTTTQYQPLYDTGRLFKSLAYKIDWEEGGKSG